MNSPRSAILIQARSNSSRLPGKIFAGIPEAGSTPQLLHIYQRMQLVGADVVAVLAPHNDERLLEFCRNWELEYFTGPELDVRERYRSAAEHYNIDWIVRATGDNPAVDVEIARDTLFTLQAQALDLFSFTNLPLGMAVEAFRSDCLSDARILDGAGYREHVSLHIKRHPERFQFEHAAHPGMQAWAGLPKPRMTVDTQEDLAVMRQTFSMLGDDFGISEVMHLFQKDAEHFHLNAGIAQRDFAQL